MTSALDLAELLAELFSWIGLLVGVVLFLVLGLLRAARGAWDETEGVVVDGTEGAELRWMSVAGRLHSRPLTASERSGIADPEQLRLYYSRRDPERMTLQQPHGARLLWVLGLVFLGIGLVASLASIILLLAGG